MSAVIDDINHIDDLVRALEELERYYVEIGILGDSGSSDGSSILMIAAVHEFGLNIKVTPKMRAWFAYQGFPMKKDTLEIRIPERSFMRAGWDKHVSEIGRKADAMVQNVLDLEMSAEDFYNSIGGDVAGLIETYITDLKNPALSDMTIARRKSNSSNPLVDSSRLSGAITWKVVRG